LTFDSGAQEDGDQFGIGQRGGAACLKSFAWPVRRGHFADEIRRDGWIVN
jgi:hypothetical protein